MVTQTKTFGFVILHYLAEEMTRQCVNTLLERFGEAAPAIVIVDNASPDGSGGRLREFYASRPCVKVLLQKENLGFARGNNAGYAYLRERGDCDFIIVMNNDVLIRDAAFLERTAALYGQTHFAVCGPDIVNPATLRHQNPCYKGSKATEGFTLSELKALQARYRRDYAHPLLRQWKWRVKRRFFPFLIRRRTEEAASCQDFPAASAIREGVVLHGACYIFSRDFIQARPLCFNPGTFLYFEEDILHFECRRDGLKMIYAPMLRVEHLEDVSTNAAHRTSLERTRMKLRASLDSMEVLIKLLEN